MEYTILKIYGPYIAPHTLEDASVTTLTQHPGHLIKVSILLRYNSSIRWLSDIQVIPKYAILVMLCIEVDF